MSERSINVRLRAMVDQYRSQMQQAAQETRRFGGSVAETVRQNEAQLTRLGIGFTAVGAIAAAGFRSVIQAGGEFQASMNQVAAVSGATGHEMDQLSQQARELGASTRFSASQAAEGMGFLSMAGFDAQQTLQAMPGVLELAAAGMMDLGTAADIASNVLTGYAMEASDISRVNDVLAATFTTTNTSLLQLGEAMKYAAPVASAAGVSFEEAAAAIGLMGNAGIQASMAGTSLRGAISRLLQPSSQAATLMGNLGINAVNADGSLRPLVEIVDQLAESGATTGEMMLLFGQRAGPAMAALVSQGADALRNQTTIALESAGRAAEIAEIQMQGFQGAMVELRSALEGLKIALFESGAGDFMESMVRSITGMVRALESMPAPVQTAVMGLTGLTAGFGLLAGGLLLLAPRIVAFSDALQLLAVRAPRTAAAMRGVGSVLMGPWGLAIAGAITMAMAFSAAKERQRQIVNEVIGTLDAETGALTENTRAWIVNRLEQDGALSLAHEFGLTRQTVIDSLMGETAAVEAVFYALQDYHAEHGKTGNLEKFSDAVYGTMRAVQGAEEAKRRDMELQARQQDKWLDVAHAVDEGGMSIRDATVALRDQEPVVLNVGEAVGGLAGEYDDLEDEVQSAVQALKDLHDELRAQTDGVFAVQRATERLTDAKEKVKAATDAENASAEEIRAARLGEVAAAQDLRFALETLWGSIDEGLTSQQKLEEQTRILIRDFGLSEAAARELIQAFLEYEAVSGSIRETRITVDVSQAMAALRALQAEFAKIRPNLRSDDLRLRAGDGLTPTYMHDGGLVARFHDGGGIGGGLSPWGALRHDEVPIIAQTGEVVLSRRQVAEIRSAPSTHQTSTSKVVNIYGDVDHRTAFRARDLAGIV